MTVLTAEEAKKALNGISSRPFQSDVLSAEEAKKALRSVPKSDNREPRTYTVPKPQEPKVYRRNADGVMSEAGTFESAAAPAISGQKDMLAPLSKPQVSAQKDLLAPISRPQMQSYTSQRDGVTMQLPQIDQWNANAAMPAVKELAGKAVNMGTNILFPLKGMKQGLDLLTGKTQSTFDPEAERQALSQMGAVQRGVERVAGGLNSIVETPAAALRYAGETAVQAGKNLAENFQKDGYGDKLSEAVYRKIKNQLTETAFDPVLLKYVSVPIGTPPDKVHEAYLKLQEEKGAEQAASAALKEITTDTPVDPNSAGSQMMQQTQERQAAAVEGLSPTGQFIGNTLASVGQNAMLMPLAAINPAVPLAGMAGMAGAGKAYEVQQAGGGAMEALARGTVSGLIEAATEKLPLDNLLKIASSPVGKKAIWNILEQMGTEATEEAVSYVANYIADAAAKDPNAEFSLKDMALSALGGGLSGGIMGAGGTVAGYARNGNVNVQAAQPTQESAFTRQAGTDANAAQSAAQVDSGWIDGFSEQEAQNLTSHKGIVNGRGMGFSEFAQKARALGNGIRFYFGKVSGKLANAISGAVGKDLTGYNIAIRSDEVVHSYRNHGNAATEALRGHLPVNEQTISQLPRVFENPDEVALLSAKDYAGRTAFEVRKNLDGYVVAVVGVADGRHSIEIDSVRIIKKKGTPTTANSALRAQDHTSETSSGQYLSPDLTLPQQAEGVNTSIPGSGAENDMLGEISDLREPDYLSLLNGKGGLLQNEYSKKFNRRTRRALDAAGKKLGVGIVFDPQIDGDGYYDGENRTIHVSMQSSDPLNVVLTHEMTHRMKETSPDLYQEFSQLAAQAMQNAGTYGRVGAAVEMAYGTPDADEVTAHYTRMLVSDISEFEKLVGVNRNLAQKMLDLLDEMFRKLGFGDLGSQTNSAEADRQFGSISRQDLEQTRRAWREMLQKADAGAETQDGIRRHVALNAEADIDRVLNGERLRTQVRLRDYTPAALVDRGIPDLPMYMNAAHIRENILNEAEARAKGLPADERIHYHGLGKDLFLQAVDAMDGPIEVFQWRKNPYNHYGPKDYLVITQVTDQNGNRVAVPVVINSTANANNAYIDVNEIKSIYGKDGLEEYLSRYTADKSLSRVKRKKPVPFYDAGENTSGISQGQVSSDPTVPQTEPGVNPYSMQEGKKYSRPLARDDSQSAESRPMPEWMEEAYQTGVELSRKYPGYDYDSALRRFAYEDWDAFERAMPFHRPDKWEWIVQSGFAGRRPEFVRAIRYGEIPKSGRSTNHANGELEKGVSAVKILRKPEDFNKKSIYDATLGWQDISKSIIEGWYIGSYGSDGEPLLIDPQKANLEAVNPDAPYSRSLLPAFRAIGEGKADAGLLKKYGLDDLRPKQATAGMPEDIADLRPGKQDGRLYAVAPELREAVTGESMLDRLKSSVKPHESLTGSRLADESSIKHLGEADAFDNVKVLLEEAMDERAERKKNAEEPVAQILDSGAKKENVNLLDKLGDAKLKLVDSGAQIDKIGKALGDDVLYPLYNNAKQARQAAMYHIGEAQTDLQGRKIGKSVMEIFEPIKAQGNDYFKAFEEYLFHRHNVDSMTMKTRGAAVLQRFLDQVEAQHPELAGKSAAEVRRMRRDPAMREAANEWLALKRRQNGLKDKPVFGYSVTAEDSMEKADALRMEHPEFEQLSQDVYAYYRNQLQNEADAGLISAKERELLNQLYPHYVPVITEEMGVKPTQNGRFAGVADVHKNREGNVRNLIPIDEAMARNTLSSVAAAKRNLFGVRLLEGALSERGKVGRDVQSVYDADIPYGTDDVPRLDNEFMVWVDGSPTIMRVSNPLMEGVNSMMPKQVNKNELLELMRKGNTAFKIGVTSANPAFLVRNGIRDIQDAVTYTKDLKSFVKNYPKAYQEIMQDGEMWQLYKSMGGTGDSFFDYEKGLMKKEPKTPVGGFIAKMQSLNEMVEQAPRLAEFMSTIQKGGTGYENVQRALLDAADVTVNFGRSGELTKALNSTVVPFLNPSVQGTSKFIRNLSQGNVKAWVRTIAKMSLAGLLPSLINELAFGDDEEYQMLSDSVKDNYFLFPIGDGRFFRLPKGRAGMPVGNLATRAVRAARGQEPDMLSYLQSTVDSTAPQNPFKNNLLAALNDSQLFDSDSPGRTWYGGQIEPERLRSLEPGDRTDENTDAFSTMAGKAMGISPKKINYLLDQYTGFAGDMLLPLMTPAARENLLISNFVTDSVMSNRLADDFYSAKDQAQQAFNSRYNPLDKARYDALSDAAKDISEGYARIRDVQVSDLPKDEKLSQVREIRKGLNEKLKAAVAAADEAYERAQTEWEDIPDEVYYNAYIAQKGAQGDKDRNGKTVALSASKNKKRAIDAVAKGLTTSQKRKLYEAFGVSKEVW